jgi:hypothetical protein
MQSLTTLIFFVPWQASSIAQWLSKKIAAGDWPAA